MQKKSWALDEESHELDTFPAPAARLYENVTKFVQKTLYKTSSYLTYLSIFVHISPLDESIT